MAVLDCVKKGRWAVAREGAPIWLQEAHLELGKQLGWGYLALLVESMQSIGVKGDLWLEILA